MKTKTKKQPLVTNSVEIKGLAWNILSNRSVYTDLNIKDYYTYITYNSQCKEMDPCKESTSIAIIVLRASAKNWLLSPWTPCFWDF